MPQAQGSTGKGVLITIVAIVLVLAIVAGAGFGGPLLVQKFWPDQSLTNMQKALGAEIERSNKQVDAIEKLQKANKKQRERVDELERKLRKLEGRVKRVEGAAHTHEKPESDEDDD